MRISEKHLGCVCDVRIDDSEVETGLIVSTNKTGIQVYIFDRYALVTVQSSQISKVSKCLTASDVEEFLLLRVW